MNARRVQPRLRSCLLWMVLCLPLWAQTPEKPGRLVIKSVPPKATIVINNQTWRQPTDTTVVVPPGDYKVSVTSDKLKNCPAKAVKVQPDSETELICTEAGWGK